MIIASIYSGDVLTNQGTFDSQTEAEQWVAYHGFSEPVYEDITAKLEQDKINQECLQYLAETDFYIVRQMENPSKPVPEEVLVKRQLCRDSIIK